MKKLIVKNLKDFFEVEFKNQFQMLGELEKKVFETDEVQQVVLVEYKTEGDAIFDLVKIEYGKNIVYTYQFTTTIS
jgi:hypothetical protein